MNGTQVHDFNIACTAVGRKALILQWPWSKLCSLTPSTRKKKQTKKNSSQSGEKTGHNSIFCKPLDKHHKNLNWLQNRKQCFVEVNRLWTLSVPTWQPFWKVSLSSLKEMWGGRFNKGKVLSLQLLKKINDFFLQQTFWDHRQHFTIVYLPQTYLYPCGELRTIMLFSCGSGRESS